MYGKLKRCSRPPPDYPFHPYSVFPIGTGGGDINVMYRV